jgi:2-methylcitrate dehydratase PrpD
VGGSGLGVSQSDFTDATLADPLRRGLADSTEVEIDEDCNNVFPHQFPGVVRVALRDGSELEERVMQNRGGPNRPISRAELMAKLELNTGALSEGIRDAGMNLEKLDSIHLLMQCCG